MSNTKPLTLHEFMEQNHNIILVDSEQEDLLHHVFTGLNACNDFLPVDFRPEQWVVWDFKKDEAAHLGHFDNEDLAKIEAMKCNYRRGVELLRRPAETEPYPYDGSR